MQVYVHLAGKNHGPYSIDQLRQFVQAGNFRDDHLACYDGTNWVKIRDVPGFAVEVSEQEESREPSKFTLVLCCILILTVAVAGYWICMIAETSHFTAGLVSATCLASSPFPP